jgi:uncharacterized protein with GYD domain
MQVSYTPEAWRTLVKNPVDRTKAIRPAIEKLGGNLEGGWFAFGDYDIILVVRMPDNVSAAAFSLAAAAGGAVKTVKTTPLMDISEGIAAIKRAAKSGYKPPGR